MIILRHWLLKVFPLLFLTGLLAACGGGGGGTETTSQNNESAPTILTLYLSPREPGTFGINMDFTDNDGNLATITVVVYDSIGTELDSMTADIIGVEGIYKASLSGNIDFSWLPAGDYLVEFFISDTDDLQSNIIVQNFDVSGGLGVGINYPNPNDRFMGETAIGDLNDDGLNDVVAIQGSYNIGEIYIRYQNEEGTLDEPILVDLDGVLTGIQIADINSDGKNDLVVAGNNSFFILHQDPITLQLGIAIEYSVHANMVSGLVVADLNDDGLNDIVVQAPQVGFQGELSFFFQNSGGTLESEVFYNHMDIVMDGEIHIADMNDDGLNDVVFQSSNLELSVLHQWPTGNFNSAPDTYQVQTNGWPYFDTFALGDFNGDGLYDVVATYQGDNPYLNIYLQNAMGTLDPPNLISLSNIPYGVEAVDLTGDGLDDILFNVFGGVVVYEQQPDHTFGPNERFNYYTTSDIVSQTSEALSMGDVNGDGQLDAVLTWSNDGLYIIPYAANIVIRNTD